MRKPKISVIIPIYNTAKYLRKCIESVINQTYDNLEIILVDDGSTDGSSTIVDEYGAKDSRIIAIHKENGGVSAARNDGLKKATGEYIGFVDGDDWIEPDMYQRMQETLGIQAADMIICGYFKDTDEKSVRVTNEEPVMNAFDAEQLLRYVFYRDSYRAVAAYPWNKLFRKDLIQQSFFDSAYRIGEDVLWFTEVMLEAKQALYIERPLYHYIQRDTSLFHSNDARRRTDSIRAYQQVIQLLEEHKIAEDIITYVKRFLAYHAMNIAGMALEQGDRETYREMCLYMRKYEKEYKETNAQYADRLEGYDRILHLEI